MCHQVFQQRLKEIVGFLQLFEQVNILQSFSSEQRGFIAQTALYYGLFWQPYLEVLGERPTKENVMRGVQMIRLLLEPYQCVS